MQFPVGEIVEIQAAGLSSFPVVEFDDVLAGRVGEPERDAIRSAGCVVLRGTFDPAEAEAWNHELGRYLADNVFQERFLVKHPGAATASRIWPVYWSRPQVVARQHGRMTEPAASSTGSGRSSPR